MGHPVLWSMSVEGTSSFYTIVIPMIYYSTQMLQRYIDSPVMMSFNSNPRPITEIPFPGVTICNMNKASNSRSQMTVDTLNFVELAGASIQSQVH